MAITTGDGKTYPTISDVCRKEFGVSEKTFRTWIASRFVDKPPQFRYGRRPVYYFPPEYVEATKRKIHADQPERTKAPRGRRGHTE